MKLEELQKQIRRCKICRLPKESYPLFQGNHNAKIMVISQAPSLKATQIGQKWKDNLSGKTLRSWFGLADEVFYNENLIYLTALGKCYPGKGKGGDKLPNPICAQKWLAKEIETLKPKLVVTVGKRSFSWFFPERDYDKSLAGKPLEWKGMNFFPLPHPSGANNAWKTRNSGRLELIVRNLRKELRKWAR
ncbi:MAG TPA: uracil-DNA glycosylase family protein [archaeon]|jgi:uracil-DNA glycosylase family 4|nr:uracil-DNA glycosylase family protein [archaeon]